MSSKYSVIFAYSLRVAVISEVGIAQQDADFVWRRCHCGWVSRRHAVYITYPYFDINTVFFDSKGNILQLYNMTRLSDSK